MRRIDARELGAEAVTAEVATVVAGGGTVVFPTDTVYGIGCDPGRAQAVERIFALKGRPRGKPLALHVAGVEEFLEIARGNAMARRLAEAFLPGALTVIVRRPPSIAAAVSGGLDTIGLRVPDHTFCRRLLARTGTLAATSANLSDLPAFTGTQAATGLPEADVFVDDGPTPLETESTVIDVSEAKPRLVRVGAIPTTMLEQALGVPLG